MLRRSSSTDSPSLKGMISAGGRSFAARAVPHSAPRRRGGRVAPLDVDALSFVGEGRVLGIDRDAELSALAALATLRSRGGGRSEGQRGGENAIPHRWCRARRGSPTSLPGS